MWSRCVAQIYSYRFFGVSTVYTVGAHLSIVLTSMFYNLLTNFRKKIKWTQLLLKFWHHFFDFMVTVCWMRHAKRHQSVSIIANYSVHVRTFFNDLMKMLDLRIVSYITHFKVTLKICGIYFLCQLPFPCPKKSSFISRWARLFGQYVHRKQRPSPEVRKHRNLEKSEVRRSTDEDVWLFKGNARHIVFSDIRQDIYFYRINIWQVNFVFFLSPPVSL